MERKGLSKLLTPVFIRDAASLLSTSVFSKCEVRGTVYNTVLTCNASFKVGGLTASANSGVPKITIRCNNAQEGLLELKAVIVMVYDQPKMENKISQG